MAGSGKKMTVNSTYITNATSISDQMIRFSAETGYIYGHGLVILVGLYAAYITSRYGAQASLAYGLMFSFLASLILWLAGWESSQAVIFCGSGLALVILFVLLDRSS